MCYLVRYSSPCITCFSMIISMSKTTGPRPLIEEVVYLGLWFPRVRYVMAEWRQQEPKQESENLHLKQQARSRESELSSLNEVHAHPVLYFLPSARPYLLSLSLSTINQELSIQVPKTMEDLSFKPSYPLRFRHPRGNSRAQDRQLEKAWSSMFRNSHARDSY